MPQTAIPKPLASIDHAADQICLIIAAERADASEPVLHHLKQVQIQFDSFRASVDATRAAQVVMVAKAERKAAHLAKILDGLLSTLREAGIFHFQGRLAFGSSGAQWFPGLRPRTPGTQLCSLQRRF
ncbi:hypothetical protein C8J57DRAFT_1496925 [Mycena rebaudengoi]|nr:hypothetical protein C8J57DRAFT_1496925 [Mycena rebaudengoi]